MEYQIEQEIGFEYDIEQEEGQRPEHYDEAADIQHPSINGTPQHKGNQDTIVPLPSAPQHLPRCHQFLYR
jgi:hypothetical protein